MAGESFDFELRLVDNISASANRAAKAISDISRNADKARSALSDNLGKQFEKVGFAAARAAAKQQKAFADSWEKIGLAAQKAQEKAQRAAEKAHAASAKGRLHGVEAEIAKIKKDPASYRRLFEAQKELRELQGKLGKESFGDAFKQKLGFGKLFSAAFLGDLAAEGVLKVGESIVEGAVKAVEIFTDGIKDAFKGAAHEETSRISENNILGKSGAKEFREDVEGFAKNSPFDPGEIRKLLLPIRRAGISQAAARQMLATASDIGGGDAGAVGGILETMRGIYTRKGVSKRQIVGLLGNVGGTVPDFYKSLGKNMHVSSKEAERRAASGQVDPQMIMNMITEAQNKRQGGIAGTGGLAYAKSLEVEWKKLNALPEEYFKKLVDTPGYAKAVAAIGKLLEGLDPESPTGQRIMASVEHMFDKITGFIGDPAQMADNLSNLIESAVGFGEDLISTFKNLSEVLLPSIEGLENMVLSVRTLKAYASFDEKQIAAANRAEAVVLARRTTRGIESHRDEIYQQHVKTGLVRAELDATLNNEYMPVDINSVKAEAKKKTDADIESIKRAAGIPVTMNVTNNVMIKTDPGEDAATAVKRHGDVHKSLTDHAAAAARQAGG